MLNEWCKLVDKNKPVKSVKPIKVKIYKIKNRLIFYIPEFILKRFVKSNTFYNCVPKSVTIGEEDSCHKININFHVSNYK